VIEYNIFQSLFYMMVPERVITKKSIG